MMIEIVPYQSAWPREFREIASRLRGGLGALALRIDHIGSTAVVGLVAKDIIDIQITVSELSDELQFFFESIGYSFDTNITRDHRPAGTSDPDNEWSKWFFRAPPRQRATNTHVRITERGNQRYALLFRDYLRSHPCAAAAYSQLKQSLAHELRDTSRYPAVKDSAVDLIYHAANDWAIAANWRPGPTDS
jgi:GrpB-like predicted nucleotidyltransferase (UPF0157 family)